MDKEAVRPKGFEAHPSHRLRNKGKYTWYSQCGLYTTGVRMQKLGSACLPVKAWGRQVLGRIAKGRTPANDFKWGELE